MLERIYLLIPASDPKAEMKTGKKRCLVVSTTLPHSGRFIYSLEWMPDMGSQPSLTPKRSMQMSASQKPGMENPMNTKTVMDRSRALPLLSAEITPKGMAARKMMIMDEMLM
jgi:hypothetical protein